MSVRGTVVFQALQMSHATLLAKRLLRTTKRLHLCHRQCCEDEAEASWCSLSALVLLLTVVAPPMLLMAGVKLGPAVLCPVLTAIARKTTGAAACTLQECSKRIRQTRAGSSGR